MRLTGISGAAALLNSNSTWRVSDPLPPSAALPLTEGENLNLPLVRGRRERRSCERIGDKGSDPKVCCWICEPPPDGLTPCPQFVHSFEASEGVAHTPSGIAVEQHARWL